MSTTSIIPANVEGGQWRMQCTAESFGNRGIVNRRYDQWGPVLFPVPKTYLTYSLTTEGEYSEVSPHTSAKTECVFAAHEVDGRWVELAGVASLKSGPLTDAMKRRKRAKKGLTDAFQKGFRASQDSGLGVEKQVPSHMRGFIVNTTKVPPFDSAKHVSSLVDPLKLSGESATYEDVYLTVLCPFGSCEKACECAFTLEMCWVDIRNDSLDYIPVRVRGLVDRARGKTAVGAPKPVPGCAHAEQPTPKKGHSVNRIARSLMGDSSSFGRTPTHQDHLSQLPMPSFTNGPSHVQRSAGINPAMASKDKQLANENLWARPEMNILATSYLEGVKREVETNNPDAIVRLNGAGEGTVLVTRKSSYKMLRKVRVCT
eukprot:CAMPEP_0198214074 /NCGR_PEP_ID=MMETSP1445-20131203/37207_1 /TAXON_ID=36898 /ORGANISM="Pyramimonas sp., Strain CCMP2087" /LENGTH=371 /DNA_ID=CAMNT_0043889051 /DNA_START=252 /DNA_END=1364 /DNA_ORIENTATION=+